MLIESEIFPRLEVGDDRHLWRVALETILGDLRAEEGMCLEIGRCSHWLRPHGYRWMADGGFAYPVGYGGSGYSLRGKPLFDWFVIWEWRGDEWRTRAGEKSGDLPAVRIAIPSRTIRHAQAAVNTIWTIDGKTRLRLYGFRKKDGMWHLTANAGFETPRPNDRTIMLEKRKMETQRRHQRQRR